jgi:hypothetical protein
MPSFGESDQSDASSRLLEANQHCDTQSTRKKKKEKKKKKK